MGLIYTAVELQGVLKAVPFTFVTSIWHKGGKYCHSSILIASQAHGKRSPLEVLNCLQQIMVFVQSSQLPEVLEWGNKEAGVKKVVHAE